jgi:PH domain
MLLLVAVGKQDLAISRRSVSLRGSKRWSSGGSPGSDGPQSPNSSGGDGSASPFSLSARSTRAGEVDGESSSASPGAPSSTTDIVPTAAVTQKPPDANAVKPWLSDLRYIFPHGVVHEGFLKKKSRGRSTFGSFMKNWASRHFKLYSDRVLQYATEEGEVKGEVDIQRCQVSLVSGREADSNEFVFEIQLSQLKGERLILAADTREARDVWLELLVAVGRQLLP